jgi:hypothetical protein
MCEGTARVGPAAPEPARAVTVGSLRGAGEAQNDDAPGLGEDRRGWRRLRGGVAAGDDRRWAAQAEMARSRATLRQRGAAEQRRQAPSAFSGTSARGTAPKPAAIKGAGWLVKQ